MKPIKIINYDTDHRLHIGFTIGTTCNYKCHYCFEGCNDGKYRFPENFELVKKNFTYIINLYRNHFKKSHIRINITGGEPSLWPRLGEFAEYFSKELDCKISLSTNGSRTLNFWMRYAKFFDDIHISIHNEFCDPDHIIRVMDWIYENEKNVLINGTVLMDPFHWDRCVSIAEKLKNHPTPWLLKVRPILLNGQMDHYESHELDYMREKIKKRPPEEWINNIKSLGTIQSTAPNIKVFLDNGDVMPQNTFEIFENNWQHFAGWSCNLGVDRFTIERNGDIQGSCGARNLFGLSQPLSIYDENLDKKFTPDIVNPIICPQQYCICATDVRTTKHNVQFNRN